MAWCDYDPGPQDAVGRIASVLAVNYGTPRFSASRQNPITSDAHNAIDRFIRSSLVQSTCVAIRYRMIAKEVSDYEKK